jgi:hypothetical protein
MKSLDFFGKFRIIYCFVVSQLDNTWKLHPLIFFVELMIIMVIITFLIILDLVSTIPNGRENIIIQKIDFGKVSKNYSQH